MQVMSVNLADHVVVHPLADVFPLIAGDELDELVESIKRDGQQEPCVFDTEGRLIDGRNRFVACLLAEVEPLRKSKHFNSEAEIARFIWAENVLRRHLNVGQRAMFALEFLPVFEKDAHDRQVAAQNNESGRAVKENLPEQEPGQSRDQAGKLFNVSGRSISTAKKVSSESPALAKKVMAGEISLNAAATELKQKAAPSAPDPDPDAAFFDDGEEESTGRRHEDLTTHSALIRVSSESNEWYTPGTVIELAHELMGGVDVDPASCDHANQVVQAKTFYTEETNGLDKEWAGRVWLNPPYGRGDGGQSNQGLWSQELDARYEAGEVEEALLLVNAVTDTKWFHSLWHRPVCFIRGRLDFYKGPGEEAKHGPTHGNAVFYFGANQAGFREIFSRIGHVVMP